MKYTQPLVRSVFFLSLLLLIFYTTFASVRLIAHIEVPHRAKAKKVAIIGAGAGGTSAAYWISEAFGNSSIQVESTIFEKSNYVGGRSTTVTLKRDEKEYIIEVGASIFIDANLHLFNSAKRFGLEFTKFGGEFPGARVGIWDGEQLVFEESSYSYWDMVKILWKYGWAPLKVRNMVKATITKFMKIYQFEDPFTCIESAVDQLDLRTEHEKSAEYYFIEMKSLYPLYLQHFVEPATRVNYASNLNQIHAMGGFISLAPQGAKSIKVASKREIRYQPQVLRGNAAWGFRYFRCSYPGCTNSIYRN
ncbi:hypothetical protein G9A89_008339 [Geosiphon pyriformis]|nr:hypothetical protein G9A89_008339 [Geosiphon pyriformis]